MDIFDRHCTALDTYCQPTDTTPAVEPYSAEEAREDADYFTEAQPHPRNNRLAATLRAYADMLDAQATPADDD